MRVVLGLITAGLCSIGPAGASALAQAPPGQHLPPAALDVPYLPQSVLLCGGAALAMVERWWGRRGVYAEDFAGLVRPELGGIRTADLAAAARARGWNTQATHGTPELVQRLLGDGVPVLLLIEVARDRFHYVVVLGWSDGQVVFHDPADAPSITVDDRQFLARWTGADRWALVVQPAAIAAVTAAAAPTDPVPVKARPCAPWLDQALDAAATGALDEAARLLEEASRACPGEPLVARELAGVRFRQGRYREASRLAAGHVERVPDDSLGWQLLATSRYLGNDPVGALDAWNRIGRPTVDLVRIDGSRGIRFRSLARAASVSHGTMLTPSSLALARRRLSDIPALRSAAVDYQPVAGGLVELRVTVAPRPVVPRIWGLGAEALRAVTQDEAGLEVASPTGAGELWTGSLRWEFARPRAAVAVEMPAALGFPGVVRIGGAWERFRFTTVSGPTSRFEESRRSAVAGFGGWASAGVRPSVGLRLERWSRDRDYLALSGGGELLARDDHVVIAATVEHAVALSTHPSYTRGGARGIWASSLGLGRAAWSTRIGFEWASRDAPLGTWPVAGGNLSWQIPLRATPSSGGRPLAGRSAGRGIIHTGIAGDHPVYRLGPLILAAGVFLDAARVVAPADGSGMDRSYLDGGAGLRIGIAEGQLGVLRIDFARGLLADRRSAVTIGVHRNWPPFPAGPR